MQNITSFNSTQFHVFICMLFFKFSMLHKYNFIFSERLSLIFPTNLLYLFIIATHEPLLMLPHLPAKSSLYFDNTENVSISNFCSTL